MATKKRVAILGAGISGLAAIKSCLEEDLEPFCFEQNDNIGGLWYFTEEYREGQGARAFDKLTTNASKEMFAYSDFPYSSDSAPFMRHNAVFDYLKSYCNRFGLNKYIQLKTKVLKVKRSHDYHLTGTWLVETETFGKEPRSEIFDCVIVCSGFYKKSLSPNVPGMDTFKGTIDASKNYKNGSKYNHQRVVVVGNGNSSADMAAGAAEYADQVFYSVGPGMWMMPKIGLHGIPYDINLFTRANFKNPSAIDRFISKTCNDRLDIVHSGLSPSTLPTRSRCMVNDEVQAHIMNGRIKIYGRLVGLGPHEAEFDDGSVVNDLDAVLFATGYDISLDFLDETLRDENGKFSLYKMVFPLHLPHPTLAMIGCQEIDGPYPPILELQGRFAARVFSGQHKLPTREAMGEDIDRWNKFIYDLRGKYKYLMPVFPFRDEIAAEVGVIPSWLDLIKAGPKIAYNYLYGPAFPYYERLWGPHPWSGAKKAIEAALDHGSYAPQPRKIKLPKITGSHHLATWLTIVAVLVAVMLKYFIL